TICVYSLRARERPTVSTPVTWDEVRSCFKKGDSTVLVFESKDVLNRMEKFGDLFEPVLKKRQKLPSLEALGAPAPKQGSVSAKLEAKNRTAASNGEPRTPRSPAKKAARRKKKA